MLVAQSCPTLCHSLDCSTPGSSVHGILQARILEWVAIPSPRKEPESDQIWAKQDDWPETTWKLTPITIKPETVNQEAEQSSCVPVGCSSPGASFPTKSFALSACVSPWTIHFPVLDKSPLSGPGRGPLPATVECCG